MHGCYRLHLCVSLAFLAALLGSVHAEQETLTSILGPGIGASYGTSKSGVGIAAMGVLRPDLMMKCIVPVVMAGIIAVRSPISLVPVLGR